MPPHFVMCRNSENKNNNKIINARGSLCEQFWSSLFLFASCFKKHLKQEISYCQLGAVDAKKNTQNWKGSNATHTNAWTRNERSRNKKKTICKFVYSFMMKRFFPFLTAVLDLRQKNGRLTSQSTCYFTRFDLFFSSSSVCLNAESTIYQMMFKPNTQERPSWYCGSVPMRNCAICMRIKEE